MISGAFIFHIVRSLCSAALFIHAPVLSLLISFYSPMEGQSGSVGMGPPGSGVHSGQASPLPSCGKPVR